MGKIPFTNAQRLSLVGLVIYTVKRERYLKLCFLVRPLRDLDRPELSLSIVEPVSSNLPKSRLFLGHPVYQFVRRRNIFLLRVRITVYFVFVTFFLHILQDLFFNIRRIIRCIGGSKAMTRLLKKDGVGGKAARLTYSPRKVIPNDKRVKTKQKSF